MVANGRCEKCEDEEGCLVCSYTTEKCELCKEGFRLFEGQCLPCGQSMHHCVSCSSGNKCDMCDYNVAVLDETGKCGNCRTDYNWVKNEDLGMCECSHFMNAKRWNLCQTCSEAIPGCKTCEQTDTPGDALHIELGYDPILSPRPGKFLKCTECGDNMQRD
jgi:hypothetical protein